VSGLLLDTNIPSELIRSQPEPRIERWFYAQDEQSLFLSAISIGELRRGFMLLPAGKRRNQLEHWFHDDLVPRFGRRILPVTHAIADRWGILGAERQLAGTPLDTADGLIAATALEHGLIVVTRNVRDFARLGVPLFDPWTEVPRADVPPV
jgi:predicted nucleic acid-binding protein